MKENEAQAVAQQLMPHIIKRLNRNSQGTSTTPASVSTVTVDSAKAALEAHKLLDFVDAHGTSDPAINHHRTYYSVNFGIVGGTGVDESNNIQIMLTNIGLWGGGTVVISATNYADPVIYIEKTISIYYSNVHVVFDPATLVSYGVTGCLRIMGAQDEFTRKLDGSAMKLSVNSTSNASNQTILQLSATDTALMDAEAIVANRIVVLGDKLSVRGLNDITGKAVQKDTTFVYSLAKVGSYWQITCTDEMDYTFQPHYTTGDTPISSSDWLPDATTGTTIYIVRYGSIATDLPAGSVTATVNSIAGFAVGDVVQVGDARTEHDYNASALKSDGTGYANPAALELMYIIGFNMTFGDTNKIYFDRATIRIYKAGAPYYGGVARCIMVRNSSISGMRANYHAANISTSYNTLQMTYAVECEVHHCTINGYTYVDGTLANDFGRSGHALRMSYALNCKAYANKIRDCLYSTSGKGYGITDYYSTGNQIYSNTVSGCRHNYLMQLSTNVIILGNESRNHLISGIDFHGVNSFGGHVHGNTITQANGSTTDSAIAAGVRIGNTSHSNGDHNIVVEDNIFIWNNGATDIAFDFVAASSDIIFRNNTVWYALVGVKFTLNSSQVTPVQTATNITIEGNRFVGCGDRPYKFQAQPVYGDVTGDGIFDSNGKINGLNLINNTDDSNNRHIEIVGISAGGINNVLLENNTTVNSINTSGRFGINVSDVAGLQIYGNNLHGCNKGIQLQNCTGPAEMVQNIITGIIDGAYQYVDLGGNTGMVHEYNTGYDTGGVGGSSFTTDVTITNTDPQIYFVETDAATDNTRWDIGVNGGIMNFRVLNDAASTATNWMTVARTLNVANSIALAATYLNLTGNVGIGIASTAVPFEIFKAGTNDPIAKFGSTGASDSQALWVTNGTAHVSLAIAGSGSAFTPGSAAGDAVVQAGSGKKILLSIGGTNSALTVDGAGKIGVGTTTPAYQLSVVNAVAKSTAATTTSMAVGSNDTSGVSDLLYYVRMGGSATQTSRFVSVGSYENSFGGQALLLQELGGRVGIGSLLPTAFLDLPASGTTYASLRIRSGTAPTTPNDGDIWFDGTNLKMRIGGVTKTFTVT